MRYLFLVGLLFLTGCGVAEDIGLNHCGGDLKDPCRLLFGGNIDEEQDETLIDLQAQIDALDSSLTIVKAQASVLQSQSTINTDAIASLQSSQASLVSRIAALETRKSVSEYIDPCGDHPSKLDEIILRMSDGSLIASVSDNTNGNNTRLSRLSSGNFMTTDGTSCNFAISSSGVVSW